MVKLLDRTIATATLVALAWAGAADAALYTVGNSGPTADLPQGDFTCSHATIQDAVNAAAATPNAPGEDEDVIRVSYTGAYLAQQVEIGSIDLEISGGYHDCWASQQGWYEPNRQTTVSGAGGAAAPVFRVRGSGVRTFRSLFITRGDNAGGDGGGIDYQGIGRVVLVDTQLGANTANRGGGIYARGFASVRLGANVQLVNNVAAQGGGLYIAHYTGLEMTADGSTLYFNRATSEGGGLYVESPAYAKIGSPGWNGIGAIDSNRAPDGAGISVHGSDYPAPGGTNVELVAADVGRPVRVAGNVASFRGGAVYAKGHLFDSGGPSPHSARVSMNRAVLEANEAPHGAALYLDNESSGGGSSQGSLALLTDSRIERNRGTATDRGSIIRVDPGSGLEAARVTLARNEATHLVWVRGDSAITRAGAPGLSRARQQRARRTAARVGPGECPGR